MSIQETHERVFDYHDRKLELWVKRTDELTKLIITISSWIISIAIPLLFLNKQTDWKYIYLWVIGSIICFLWSIAIMLYTLHKAIKLDDIWLGYSKQLLDNINQYWYNSPKKFLEEGENNKIKFNMDVLPKEKEVESWRVSWLVLFFAWLFILSIVIILKLKTLPF